MTDTNLLPIRNKNHAIIAHIKDKQKLCYFFKLKKNLI
jgi:hypothetical protein